VGVGAVEQYRERRAAAITTGERAVQAELPRLIARLRAVQHAMQAFAGRMAELDRPIQGRYFREAPWVPLLSQQGLDYWVEWITATFKAERTG
jgi:hypothetical protein